MKKLKKSSILDTEHLFFRDCLFKENRGENLMGIKKVAIASWFMCGLGAMVIFASNSATIDLYIDSTTTQTNMISI